MNDTAAFLVLGGAMLVASVGWIVRPRLIDSGLRCTPDRGTTVMLLFAVPSIVALLYAQLGRFDALEPAPVDPVRAMAEQRTASLAAKIAAAPDDVAGLRLLARSYEQLGRAVEATSIRTRLVALQPDDPEALVDLAETIATTQGASLVGEPIALAQRALVLDADHGRALALVANEAAERGDFASAITAWQRILVQVPRESAVAQSLRLNLERAGEIVGADPRRADPSR